MSDNPAAPGRSTLPTATAKQARRRLAKLFRDRSRPIAVVLALTATATLAGLAGPALIGVVVDAVSSPDGDARVIDLAALLYGLLALVSAYVQYRAALKAAVVAEDALVELRTEVFDHALEVSIDSIERAGTGDLISRLTGDVVAMSQAVRWTLPTLFFAVVEIVFTIGALVFLDIRIAAVALVSAAPALLVGGRWYIRHASGCYQAERENHARLGAGLLQAFRGSAVPAAYGAIQRQRAELAGRGRAVVEAELTSTSARNRLRPSVSVAQAISLVAVLVLGFQLAADGSMTVGGVSAAALYLVRLFKPVSILLEELDEIQQATAGLARIVGVTQLPVHRRGVASVVETAAGPGAEAGRLPATGRGLSISINGLTFGYLPGEVVVSGLQLEVSAGERIVIVGPSGAGKSTLAKLLSGTHHPWSGTVRIGGRDLAAMEPEELSSAIALVDQDGHLFACSVAQNVDMARPGADDEMVAAALEAVDALGWVQALPEGAATQVGSGARAELTAAQTQQIGLARVVCANQPVVILDEATADLDPGAAQRAEAHLGRALAGHTLVTIAHRLDVAARADRVIVMEMGKITATGTHAELLAAGGTYAGMWNRWESSRHPMGATP